MPKHNTYEQDENISDNDIVLGSDAEDNLKTKNFRIGKLKEHFFSSIQGGGLQGPIGPAGPVGPAGLNWQGQWVSGTSYIIDDAVGYNGASWFCINNTSGIISPDLDATNWALLAAQGSPGPQGPQGEQGPGTSQTYKSYIALINQSGTNAPVATVIYNDTGSTFTWNYEDVGSYIATSSSPILLGNKTVVFVTAQGNSGNNQNKIFGGTRYNDTSIGLLTSSDGILKLNFEIRVYN